MVGISVGGQIDLVTGASGFIGTRLVKQLSAMGRTVRALDIAPPRQKLDNVEYLTLDVREKLALEVGEGVQTIYNFAATHRTPGHHAHEYYDTNVLGATNVTALADAASVPRLVFTSSISVYGPSEDMIFETSPLKPTSDYGRSKRMAELIHMQWALNRPDRRLVVVRPGVVFGPGEGGNFTNLAGALRRSRFVYPGRKDTIKSGGYVDELINAIQFALSKSDPFILFNFAYPHHSTTEDIVGAFGKVAGFRSKFPTAPVAPLMMAATVFEAANAMGLKNPIHRERVMKLVKSTRIAPAWLQANGYRFQTDLEAALMQWRDETGGKFT